MLPNPLAHTWKRIPSLDGLVEQLAEELDELDVIYLGDGSDGVPICAFAGPGEGPAALVLTGGSGDSVVSLAAGVNLLGQGLPGFRTWIVCGLDGPRLRDNDTQLGALAPSPAEHLAARRQPWGPGEDPEHSLPIDAAPLWQPDATPEAEVSPSPEALALARCLERLRPELVLSLREIAAGGATVAASQPLEEGDWEQLLEPLGAAELDGYCGPRMLSGRSAGASNRVVLHSLHDEVQRVKTPGTLALGPVTTWQFLQQLSSSALYLALHLPRLHDSDLQRDTRSLQTRSIQVEYELRLLRGSEQPTRVVRLVRPGHPADGSELSIERQDTLEENATLHNQPALAAWLAAEAICERQAVISEALRHWHAALAHLSGPDWQRGMQVLQSAGEVDAALRTAQTNRRYARPATQADEHYWDQVYRSEMVLLLHESLHCLHNESRTDPVVNDLRQALEEIIGQQTQALHRLTAVPAQLLAETAVTWARAAAKVACSEGPTRIRAEARLQSAQRRLRETRRAARAARHLKLPPAERQQAEQELARAEQELARAQQDALATKSSSEVDHAQQEPSEPQQEVQRPDPESDQLVRTEAPSGPELPAPPELNPEAETAENPDIKVETVVQTTPAAEDSEHREERDEGEAPRLESVPKDQPANPPLVTPVERQEAPAPPVERQETPASPVEPDDPSTWFIGPDQGRVDLEPDFDIEPLLPSRLEIPPEWGRGPMRWDDQIPKRDAQPMLRRLARKLLQSQPEAAPASQAEVDEPGRQLQPSALQPPTRVESQATGWVRRRAEPPDRYRLPPGQLAQPQPAEPGSWQETNRRAER